MYQAFVSTGLHVPDDLLNLPRTIFEKAASLNGHFYDQIAWFDKTPGVPALSLRYKKGGNFDFTKVALRSLNLSLNDLSYRISDHYPLWVEFDARG